MADQRVRRKRAQKGGRAVRDKNGPGYYVELIEKRWRKRMDLTLEKYIEAVNQKRFIPVVEDGDVEIFIKAHPRTPYIRRSVLTESK